jgi:hypothetical protein
VQEDKGGEDSHDVTGQDPESGQTCPKPLQVSLAPAVRATGLYHSWKIFERSLVCSEAVGEKKGEAGEVRGWLELGDDEDVGRISSFVVRASVEFHQEVLKE